MIKFMGYLCIAAVCAVCPLLGLFLMWVMEE